MWLKTAIARDIRVLDLNTVSEEIKEPEETPDSEEYFEFDLPASLYSCGTLEIMKIRGPFLIKLPSRVRLPKLTVLELLFVKFESNESVENLISACPVLEKLEISKYHYHGDRDLSVCKVASPSLKHVDIYFPEGCECGDCNLKIVIDTPLLENLNLDSVFISEVSCVQQAMPISHLTIGGYCRIRHLRDNGVAELLRASAGIKFLKMEDLAVVALFRGISRLPTNFERLTELVIEFPGTHWMTAMDLIDRCNSLQVLDLSAFSLEYGENLKLYDGYWSIPVRVPQCLSLSLRSLCFRSFEGLQDELAAMKFFLEHGVLLERADLRWSKKVGKNVALKSNLLHEVSRLPRASTCRLSFIEFGEK